MISSYTVLLLLLLFIVPGFIIDSVLRKFISFKEIQSSAEHLRFLLFSLYHYSLYAVPLYYGFIKEFHVTHPVMTFFLFLLIVFVSPVLLSTGIVILRNKKYHMSFFDKLGLKPVKSIPAAWDYFFGSTSSTFATVYFKDGSMVSGSFGTSSYASSTVAERDIYLEQVFSVNEVGKWEPKEESEGILISATEIKAIEFFKGGI